MPPTPRRPRTILEVAPGLKPLNTDFNATLNAPVSTLQKAQQHLLTWTYTITQLRAGIRELVGAKACPLGPDGDTILAGIVTAACGATAPTDSAHCDVLLAMLECLANHATKDSSATLRTDCTDAADLFIKKFDYLYSFEQLAFLEKVKNYLRRVSRNPKYWTIKV